MSRHRLTLYLLLIGFAVLALTSAACAAPPASAKSEVPPPATPQLKVAFIHVGARGDGGWTKRWGDAVDAAKQHFGSRIEVSEIENVQENADSVRVMTDYARRGYNLIFTTSYGYNPFVVEVAPQFPKVKFEQATGEFHPNIPNMSVVNEAVDQAYYLAGMAAGGYLRDHSKCLLGMVAPWVVGEMKRDATAYVIGARLFAPCAELRVAIINTWYNLVLEREAAQALLDAHVAVLTRDTDSTEAEKLAQQVGVPAIGAKAPSTFPVLTNAVYTWDHYVQGRIQAVLDGTWKAEDIMMTFANDGVDLVGWDKSLPEDVRQAVEAKRAAFKAGKDDIFTGPIASHNKGELCVPAGKVLGRQELRNYDCWGAGIDAPDK